MQCFRLKQLLTIFFFGINLTFGFGQDTNIDSLKTLLSTDLKDSARIEILKTIGDEYYEIDFDSILHYYQLTLDLCEKSPHYDIKVSTLRSYGYVYYNRKNDYEKSLKYFNDALNLSTEEKDSVAMAYLNSDIGRAYWKMGDTYTALIYHLKVRKVGEEIQHPRVLLRANLSLGIVENENGNNDKAKEYYQEALLLADTLKKDRMKGLVLNNLGKAYQDDSEFDIAEKYLLQADSIFSKLNDSGRMGLTRYNLGKNFTLAGSPSQGIEELKKALDYNLKIGDKEQEVMILVGLAQAYQKSNNHYNAVSAAENALSILQNSKTKLYYDEIYLTLAKSYAALNNPRTANANYQLYFDFTEEHNKLEETKKISSLKHLYDLEKKENEILALKNQDLIKEKELQKSRANLKLAIAGIITLLLLTLLFYGLVKWRQLKEIEKLKAELSKDLHDNIGSSLNRIKMLSSRLVRNNLTDEQRKKNTVRIKNISNDLMYNMYDMIWSLDSEKNMLGSLIDHMQDYTDNIFSDFQISYQFKRDLKNQNLSLNPKEKININAIFKEAINNVLKHSDSEEVLIILTQKNERFFKLEIINTFREKTTQSQLSNQNGIKNMRSRATEVGGELKIIEAPDKFTVELSI